MRNAWMLVLCVCLIAVVGEPSYAGWRLSRDSQVTVLIQDSQHNLLGSKMYADSGVIEQGAMLPEPFSAWFSLEFDLPYAALFENVPLMSSVGQTIWASSNANDPSYSAFVQSLKNGSNDTVWGSFALNSASGFVGGGGMGYSESSYFSSGTHDFAGMDIARIGLRIDACSVTQEPADLPEPSALISLACGIVGMCGYVGRRRRR